MSLTRARDWADGLRRGHLRHPGVAAAEFLRGGAHGEIGRADSAEVAPRQRERDATAFAGRIGESELRPVDQTVAVFAAHDRQYERMQPVRANDARRRAGVAGQLDLHRPFVDDDDDDDLSGIGDRREALEDIDAFEALRRAKTRGGVCQRRRTNRRADADAGELRDLLIGRRHVAVDTNFGDGFLGRRRLDCRGHEEREEENGRAHGQRPLRIRTFVLTSGCR